LRAVATQLLKRLWERFTTKVVLVGLQRPEARYESFLHAENIPAVTFDGAESCPTHGKSLDAQGQCIGGERMKVFLSENGIRAP
jgi:hypothetical protein